jgi:hypothetical protein
MLLWPGFKFRRKARGAPTYIVLASGFRPKDSPRYLLPIYQPVRRAAQATSCQRRGNRGMHLGPESDGTQPTIDFRECLNGCTATLLYFPEIARKLRTMSRKPASCASRDLEMVACQQYQGLPIYDCAQYLAQSVAAIAGQLVRWPMLKRTKIARARMPFQR